MRTWGRVAQSDGTLLWVEVHTAADGSNDLVWLVTLVQTLKLNLNEDPFYASYGIPAKQSVQTQVAPDIYVFLTQQRFSQYFASLIITKQHNINPTYDVAVTTNQGENIRMTVPV